MSPVDNVASIERLSAYLDGELSADEARDLERHLAANAASRARLEGLRRVVDGLRGLDRTPPPPTLHHMVARRVVLERERVSWADQLEQRLGSLGRQSPLLVTFAIVVALSIFMVLFSISVEKAERGTIVVVDGEQPAIGARLELAGRALFWTGEAWSEEGRGDLPWRPIELGTAAGEAWLAAHPEFDPVRQLEAPVEVEVDGQRLRLIRAK